MEGNAAAAGVEAGVVEQLDDDEDGLADKSVAETCEREAVLGPACTTGLGSCSSDMASRCSMAFSQSPWASFMIISTTLLCKVII